jgi:hypothetical protein
MEAGSQDSASILTMFSLFFSIFPLYQEYGTHRTVRMAGHTPIHSSLLTFIDHISTLDYQKTFRAREGRFCIRLLWDVDFLCQDEPDALSRPYETKSYNYIANMVNLGDEMYPVFPVCKAASR